MVPPTASNYTNAQWGASTYTDSGLIAADMAVVITSDTQGPWDRSSDPKFITPAVNSTGYVVGYGIGAQDSNFNGSDAGRRRFGALSTKGVYSNGIITFFGIYDYGATGDSGGPFYTGGGPNNRQVVGLQSCMYGVPTDQNKNSGNAYNYSPILSSAGPYYQWLNSALQQATQAVSCLSTAYNNARGQCLP